MGDLSCSKEIKIRISTGDKAINRKRKNIVWQNKLGAKKGNHMFVCSVELYRAETWTLRKEGNKRVEKLFSNMEKNGIKWQDRYGTKRIFGDTRIPKRKRNWIGEC